MQFVLGIPGGIPATVSNLMLLIKNLDPSMIINLPKRRLVLGESGKRMTEKKSILNSLFGILVLFALVFSIWGCGDSDSDNQPEPSASYVGIFGHSQDPDQGWYATTTLENSGTEMGQVLAENKPQYDCWDSATGFTLGDEQYVLSQDSDNQWMITRILPMGHPGARTDFGVWETQEVMCSLKIGSQPYIFGHRGNGAWEIVPILSGGKMGTQTDAGEWKRYYRTMAGFQMSDGRSFVFGQSEDDNDWFISEILSNGKMGTRTDEGHWDTYYKTVVVFQMHNGGTYIFGQDQSTNAWFMARILSGGKMGAKTDEGAMAYFNDALTPYQAGNKSYMFGQNQTNIDCSNLLSLKYEELMLGGGHVIFRVPQFTNESKAVALGSTSDGEGYWIVDGAGITYAFGDADPFGSGTPSGAAVDMDVKPQFVVERIGSK